MTFANYSLRPAFWPVWAWKAELPDGAERQGYALGKTAARFAARECIRNARRASNAQATDDRGGDQ